MARRVALRNAIAGGLTQADVAVISFRCGRDPALIAGVVRRALRQPGGSPARLREVVGDEVALHRAISAGLDVRDAVAVRAEVDGLTGVDLEAAIELAISRRQRRGVS
ncbi:hypothetical protein ABT369_05365 [Dactylosporangium sp. NPDC000244]|uniref:hypothetical protein n=1 Tax=Dactylosporangium sp. NPDC000244 TaxID=3154365 RepID=UPI00333465CE